jgi:hypothetical protein
VKPRVAHFITRRRCIKGGGDILSRDAGPQARVRSRRLRFGAQAHFIQRQVLGIDNGCSIVSFFDNRVECFDYRKIGELFGKPIVYFRE